jgi:hypothetical protein
MTSGALGALCSTTTSSRASTALRSMPITGVMPLPAVRNRTLAGLSGGRVKSPAAWSSMIIVPGVAWCTRCWLTLPSGMALTVIEMRMFRAEVWEAWELREVSEYARQLRTPSTSTPMRTYWPGLCPSQPRPGLMTKVTASRVSERT